MFTHISFDAFVEDGWFLWHGYVWGYIKMNIYKGCVGVIKTLISIEFPSAWRILLHVSDDIAAMSILSAALNAEHVNRKSLTLPVERLVALITFAMTE